jgi:hypothetical protein
MPRLFKQSEGTAARRRFPVYLVDATDGITPETGEGAGQPQISKNGGAFANTTATLTAIGNGSYYVELTATELDTIGLITIRYKSANTAEFSMDGQVIAIDLNDATAAGISRIDAAISSRSSHSAADVWSAATRTLTAFAFSVTVGTNNDKTGYGLSAAAIQAVWDALTAALTTVGSIGKLLVDNINATISSRGSQADVTAIKSQTDLLAFTAGNVHSRVKSADTGVYTDVHFDDTVGQEFADRLIARNIAGGSDAGRTVKEALATMRNKIEISGTTLTVYDTDDTTVLYTATITRTAGDPLSAVDPA